MRTEVDASTISHDTFALYKRDVASVQRPERAAPAEQEALLQYLPLVVSIASKYQQRGVDLLDLIQVGNLELLLASRDFDAGRSPFVYYVSFRVHKEIWRETQKKRFSFQVPEYKLDELNKVRKQSRRLSLEIGKDPTPEQLAEALSFPVSLVNDLLALDQQEATSLDERRDEDDQSAPGDLLEDDPDSRPESLMEASLRVSSLRQMLTQLMPIEQHVIRLRFGLDGGKECSYEEIGRQLHRHRESISAIEQRALLKLRYYARQIKDLLDSV